jgi:hypothetical protein
MNGGLTYRVMEERKRKADAYDRLMHRRKIQAQYLRRHREEVNRRRRLHSAGIEKTDMQMDAEALRWCEIRV